MTVGINVKDLSVTIANTAILRDVSCAVSTGELVALVGPNGAGKSTLLKAMLGLIPNISGEVSYDGTPIKDISAKARSKYVAYAPQGAPAHWPMAVEHIVGLGRIPHLSPWQSIGADDEQAIQKALNDTETDHLKGRLVTTLSGGERARVMLARAMVSGAPYLLADEPVASLDPYHQLEVMNILKAEAKKGSGVLVVMHDLSLSARYADRIILLNEGCILADGKPDVVMTDELLREAYQIKVARFDDAGEQFIIPR